MYLKENIQEGIKSIRSNMLRSILTAAIIAFGIMALVGILTAIDGLKASIDTSFSNLGANTFDIHDKRFDRRRDEGKQEKKYPQLTIDEVWAFKEMYKESLACVHTTVSWGSEIKRQSKKTNPNMTLRGVDENYMLIKEYNIEKGRNFNSLETLSGANVAIVGTQLIDALFDKKENPLGQWVTCYGMQFKIIGILEKKGSFGGTSFADRTIFIPLGAAIRISANHNLSFNITCNISDPERTDIILGEATSLMKRIRKDAPGSDDSFSIERNITLGEELDEIGGYLRIGGTVIALITLIGASINLMNSMLVSVKDRTREIGVRKAIGATPARIKNQFLIEAIIICIMGGLSGIFLGLVFGNVVGNIIKPGTFVAPWLWMLGGLICCVLVGIASGYYPASKASKLDPIESLRYE